MSYELSRCMQAVNKYKAQSIKHQEQKNAMARAHTLMTRKFNAANKEYKRVNDRVIVLERALKGLLKDYHLNNAHCNAAEQRCDDYKRVIRDTVNRLNDLRTLKDTYSAGKVCTGTIGNGGRYYVDKDEIVDIIKWLTVEVL